MEKLITTIQGGMPLTQDDFGFIQDATFNAFKDLFGAFGINPPDSFRLWGAETTKSGTTWSCSEGAIVLNGEILHVNAHSISVSLVKSARFVLKTLYHPAGLKDFKPPAGQHNVYQLRTAELEEFIQTIPSNSMLYNAPYFHEIIREKQMEIEELWQNVGSAAAPFLNGCHNTGVSLATAGYRMGNNGLIMLKGSVNIPNGLHCDVFRLPPRYRPIGSRCFIVSSDTDNHVAAYVVVQANGFVAVRSDVPRVQFDGINYYK